MCSVNGQSRRDWLRTTGGLVALGLAGGVPVRAEGRTANAGDPPAEGEELHLCVDQLLPPERLEEGLKMAVKEDRMNDVLGMISRDVDKPPPIGTPRAAIAYAKKWAQNRVLRVRFLGGETEVRKKVQQHAEEWMKHVNITFKFAASGPAEIRIAFNPNGGSWSYLGSDNLTIPSNRPTMNYGWLKADSSAQTYSSVVLHEFGHCLGMIHEHQSPGGHIQWNRPRVLQDAWREMGWSAQQVEAQIFSRYSSAQSQYTELDLTSIMMYAFKKEWTLDGTGTPWNYKLSAKDIDFMKRQYPKA